MLTVFADEQEGFQVRHKKSNMTVTVHCTFLFQNLSIKSVELVLLLRENVCLALKYDIENMITV